MPSDDKSNRNLLLVEDDEDDAFLFAHTLEKSGLLCSLSHVTDGRLAVEFLQKAAESGDKRLPQTIFLDLKMPVFNGFEFLDWIRKQSFSPSVRVIVLSGSEHETDKQRAAQLGASAYLVKPVKVSDLQRLLHDICSAGNGVPA